MSKNTNGQRGFFSRMFFQDPQSKKPAVKRPDEAVYAAYPPTPHRGGAAGNVPPMPNIGNDKAVFLANYITLVISNNGVKTVKTINDFPCVIGRAADAGLVIDESSVSRAHAVIRFNGGAFSITDLKSSNGTEVGGKPLAPSVPAVIKQGDTIKIGRIDISITETSGADSLPDSATELIGEDEDRFLYDRHDAPPVQRQVPPQPIYQPAPQPAPVSPAPQPVKQMFCTQCGHKNKEGVKFCVQCGKKMG